MHKPLTIDQHVAAVHREMDYQRIQAIMRLVGWAGTREAMKRLRLENPKSSLLEDGSTIKSLRARVEALVRDTCERAIKQKTPQVCSTFGFRVEAVPDLSKPTGLIWMVRVNWSCTTAESEDIS